jgi:hypothetical protein
MSILILQNMSSNLFILCHYSDTIVPDTNNSITYIEKNINATKGMSFEDTEKIICGRLRLNYNSVGIDITWRSLVRERQYFSILIVYDVNFKNMIELFVQSETNMMEFYVSN